MTENTKDCPFCGSGHPEIVTGYETGHGGGPAYLVIRCTNKMCGARVRVDEWSDGCGHLLEKATVKWNLRSNLK